MASARRHNRADRSYRSAGPVSRASRRAICALILTGLSLIGPARADGKGKARVVYYGQDRAPGVETGVEFSLDLDDEVTNDVQRVGGELQISFDPRLQIPAPVAISAHNCIPRTDPRGVSLAFEFSAAPLGDCISFVSPTPPEPARGARQRRAPRPSPEQLAQSAYDRMISLAPRPQLGIAPSRTGLTGLDSYFWIANDLRPISATAGVPGLTVTAEARPVQYLWNFGDGNDLSTSHPGRPWSPSRPGDVVYLYERKGRYEVVVEVVWAARWRANGGPWRDLGYFSNTDSAPYPVREMIPVLVRRR